MFYRIGMPVYVIFGANYITDFTSQLFTPDFIAVENDRTRNSLRFGGTFLEISIQVNYRGFSWLRFSDRLFQTARCSRDVVGLEWFSFQERRLHLFDFLKLGD